MRAFPALISDLRFPGGRARVTARHDAVPAAREPGAGDRADPPDIDPDVDLRDPRQRGVTWRSERPVLAVIALGGVLGAEARYGIGVLLTLAPDRFPLSTWLINTAGCALLGVLMVTVTELREVHRLVRPFLGVGVLGGFTTFSAFAYDVQELIRSGRPAVALAYWALTLAAGWMAVWLGMSLTRRLGYRSRAR